MLCCKKQMTHNKLFQILQTIRYSCGKLLFTMLLLLFLPAKAQAEGFIIHQAQAQFDKTSLSVSAKFDLQLKESAEEALHNGVNIGLIIHLNLFINRPYVWDKRIAQWSFYQEISYHSLTHRYILRSSESIESQSFPSLPDLFNKLASFDFQSDIMGETLPASKHGYKLQLQVMLDKAALPTPLRVMAYVLPAWRQKSAAHEWIIDN